MIGWHFIRRERIPAYIIGIIILLFAHTSEYIRIPLSLTNLYAPVKDRPNYNQSTQQCLRFTPCIFTIYGYNNPFK